MSNDIADHIDDAPATTWKKGDAIAAADVPAGEGTAMTAAAVTINRPVGELFSFFRDFVNFATFMENVDRIDVLDATHSHWVVKAPAGRTVEWDATVTAEVENRFIDWTSDPGADVANGGRVEFRDAGARGTVVTATIRYDPPGGIVGKVIAKMFQREPAIQARRDLRRFKQLMETGEIATGAFTNRQREEEAA
ncbi:SRPBCC family protein [uncultured Sphingomonas sp.]|uniref:SRPBCC family protein n=1 Tax=uncultured Sphingomonas sp. TaxID=158754 RepID=UPI0035CC160F